MSITLRGTVTCHCGNTTFEVIPDGANAYILKCVRCGHVSEVTFPLDAKVEMIDPEGVEQE